MFALRWLMFHNWLSIEHQEGKTRRGTIKKRKKKFLFVCSGLFLLWFCFGILFCFVVFLFCGFVFDVVCVVFCFAFRCFK